MALESKNAVRTLNENLIIRMFKNYLCEFRGHRRAIYKSSLLYFAVLKTVRVL